MCRKSVKTATALMAMACLLVVGLPHAAASSAPGDTWTYSEDPCFDTNSELDLWATYVREQSDNNFKFEATFCHDVDDGRYIEVTWPIDVPGGRTDGGGDYHIFLFTDSNGDLTVEVRHTPSDDPSTHTTTSYHHYAYFFGSRTVYGYVDGEALGGATQFDLAVLSEDARDRLDTAGFGPSSLSYSLPADAPSHPRSVHAEAGNGQATVTWDPPTSHGGSPVFRYVVTVSPGGQSEDIYRTFGTSESHPSTTATFDGLDNGTEYTFSVTAHNSGGPSATVTSNAVTPAASSDGGSSDGGSVDGDPATTERVTTSNPTTAAIAISNDRFPAEHSADYAILSRDDMFADSLAASGLNNDGPLLFTKTNLLTDSTKNELHRVLEKGKAIYLLGGKFAISEEVEAHLQDLGWETSRLAGATRVETSVDIANEIRGLNPDVKVATVARAFGTSNDETAGWVDSIAGGSWAASARAPILVTHKDQLDGPARDWLNNDNPSTTYLLGGVHALSEQVEQEAPNSSRVAGSDRAGTAVEIAKQLWGVTASGPRQFVIMNGYSDNGWAFGLAGAGAGQSHDAPTLIVAHNVVHDVTADMVSSCNTKEVDLLLMGDTTVISSDVEQTLDAQDGKAC